MKAFKENLILTELDRCSDDAFLNGKLKLLQPAFGYKAGVDAVLLASTVALEPNKEADVLDCGAGIGAVGLCVAVRCPQAQITLLEREDVLCTLAQKNILRNSLEKRVRVVKGDLTVSPENEDFPPLRAESFDYVLANPPYHKYGQSTQSKNKLKDVANTMSGESLELWVKFAARIIRPGGRYTIIHKASEISDLPGLLKGKFGSIRIQPIYSNIDEPAIRTIVDGRKGNKGELQILPPLILHKENNEFTTRVNKILREGLGLQEALAISDKE